MIWSLYYIEYVFFITSWYSSFSQTLKVSLVIRNLLCYRFYRALIWVPFFLTEHELWFLQGDSPCEGIVKSETGGYLQNITNEKAEEVCARNLCGTTKSYNSTMNSPVCPENATSPFSCSMKNTTTSTEPQFAYVKCSGNYSQPW